MNDHQDLREALAGAEAERNEAAERVREAEAALAAADAAYDASPEPDDTALEAARSVVSRVARRLEARERRVGERRSALEAAQRADDRDELERLQIALRDRGQTYAPGLAELARIDRELVAVASGLAASNAEHVATWIRAQELAHRLGDFAFEARVARPKKNEAQVLARLVVARERAAESEAHAWLEPLRRPPWNDPAMNTYDAATKLLSTVPQETP